MKVAVITPPSVVLDVVDARNAGVFAADDVDTVIEVCIAAAQATIDGPTGWLGRSVGLQTLEATVDGRWPTCTNLDWQLPFPPIRAITSVKYTDEAGVERTIDPSQYSLANDVLTFKTTLPGTARIRYQAGYSTQTPGLPDAPLPAAIHYAILLMAGQLKNLSPAAEGDVVREEVVGVGSIVYATAKSSEDALRTAAESLLSTYRVFR